MEGLRLTLEIYKTENGYGAWLSDNIGGSGIGVEENTAEKTSAELSRYIEDYLLRLND